jgi:gluconate 2-dehydrogenase gamma chain
MTISRRSFLIHGSTLGAWLAAAAACRKAQPPDAATHLPSTAADTVPPPPIVNFTPQEAADLEAMTARIIPSDGTPGAKEAGVVHFIDKYAVMPEFDGKARIVAGLDKLAKDTAKRHPGSRFAALTPAQQDEILRAMQETEFFGEIRFATICGMFALPRYGGNREFVGWDLIGQTRAFEFAPPFGWYDRAENQQALLGRVL